MEDLLSFIYVPGDLLQTVCRLFILCLSLDMILAFGALIGDSKKV